MYYTHTEEKLLTFVGDLPRDLEVKTERFRNISGGVILFGRHCARRLSVVVSWGHVFHGEREREQEVPRPAQYVSEDKLRVERESRVTHQNGPTQDKGQKLASYTVRATHMQITHAGKINRTRAQSEQPHCA